jgi:hypothetical protein
MEVNEFFKQYEQEQRDRQRKSLTLKEKVMAILQDAGVESVEVTFDGYGDSGEVGDPTVTPESAKKVLETLVPNTQHPRTAWDENSKAIRINADYSVSEAMVEICYSLLEGRGGWETNEGSFGDFVFDPKENEVRLTFNQRVEAVETDEETF